VCLVLSDVHGVLTRGMYFWPSNFCIDDMVLGYLAHLECVSYVPMLSDQASCIDDGGSHVERLRKRSQCESREPHIRLVPSSLLDDPIRTTQSQDSSSGGTSCRTQHT
jgi:hypothetical protein